MFLSIDNLSRNVISDWHVPLNGIKKISKSHGKTSIDKFSHKAKKSFVMRELTIHCYLLSFIKSTVILKQLSSKKE